MQRQAIPLISAERPIVGTGLEKIIATSFIISSNSSSFLYYISGKQSKQIFTKSSLIGCLFTKSSPTGCRFTNIFDVTTFSQTFLTQMIRYIFSFC